tara:strand:- start:10744 stop:10929 length:186 start_codon:yes stop_codon:yes gene_type:complete
MGRSKDKDDSTVKIDSSLLSEVEEFINLDGNKFKYVNKKQFINIAVKEFLNRMKKGRLKDG